MSKIVLQINYKFTTTPAEHVAMVTPAAGVIAAVAGLIWKTWLMNEAEHEAGGIYLFESREAAQAFLNGPIISNFAAQPTIQSVSAKLFDTNETLDRITRAPLALATPV